MEKYLSFIDIIYIVIVLLVLRIRVFDKLRFRDGLNLFLKFEDILLLVKIWMLLKENILFGRLMECFCLKDKIIIII